MLAIFDIDGTLTHTNAVDDACYTQAVAEILGVAPADIVWTDSPHITDTGITAWLWQRHRGSLPDAAETANLQRRFFELLADACHATPERFAPVRGATGLLTFLQANGWQIAMATGGWRTSAEFKLHAAGIDWRDIPLATSDDGMTREAIVALAHASAERRAGRSFERVVSIGDAVWDVRTASALRLPFVGVGTGKRADRLRAAGAEIVLADFENPMDTLAALARATVPALR